jgi:hypothetical protein
MFWQFDARSVMDSLDADVFVFKFGFVSVWRDFRRVLSKSSNGQQADGDKLQAQTFHF